MYNDMLVKMVSRSKLTRNSPLQDETEGAFVAVEDCGEIIAAEESAAVDKLDV